MKKYIISDASEIVSGALNEKQQKLIQYRRNNKHDILSSNIIQGFMSLVK